MKSILLLLAGTLLLCAASCTTSEAPPKVPPPITSTADTSTPAQVVSNAQPSHVLDQILSAMRNAESFELYSLQPGIRKGETLEKYQFQHFDWPLLGKITITHPETRSKIAKAFDEMVADHDQVGAPCFSPRHALRVAHQGTTFNLLICFECSWIRIYRNQKELDAVGIANRQSAFDEVLKQYNVSLPNPKTQFHDPAASLAAPPENAKAADELPLLDLEPKSLKAPERTTKP
jgi:hypothetical protein